MQLPARHAHAHAQLAALPCAARSNHDTDVCILCFMGLHRPPNPQTVTADRPAGKRKTGGVAFIVHYPFCDACLPQPAKKQKGNAAVIEDLARINNPFVIGVKPRGQETAF